MKSREYVLCAVLTKYLQYCLFHILSSFKGTITFCITMIIYQNQNHVNFYESGNQWGKI